MQVLRVTVNDRGPFEAGNAHGWFQQKLLRSAVVVPNRARSGAAEKAGRPVCGYSCLGGQDLGWGLQWGAAFLSPPSHLSSGVLLLGGSSSEREFAQRLPLWDGEGCWLCRGEDGALSPSSTGMASHPGASLGHG